MVLLFFVGAKIHALTLHEAKARDLVGETSEGYLAPAQSAVPEVQWLIDTSNGKHRQAYQTIR